MCLSMPERHVSQTERAGDSTGPRFPADKWNMSVWLMIGIAFAAWAVLSVLGGERERLAHDAARRAADEEKIQAARKSH